MNPIIFFLAIFCADGALRDYRGVEGLIKLLELQVAPGQPAVQIRWHPDVLSKPIFKGNSQRVLTSNAFSRELREVQVRAGFPEPSGLHGFRAEGLTKIGRYPVLFFDGVKLIRSDMNPTYSTTQRQRLAGHDNSQMHLQYYAGRNPGIDSQASYSGKQTRLINISQLFRDLEVKWEPVLWQSLPVLQKEKLTSTDEYREIQTRLEILLGRDNTSPTSMDLVETPAKAEQEDGTATDDSDAKLPGTLHPARKLRRDLKKLERDELCRFWEEAGDTTPTDGSGAYTCRGTDHPFSRLVPVMPDRRQLANLLNVQDKLRSIVGRDALIALCALYTSKSEVSRPGLERDRCTCNKPKR